MSIPKISLAQVIRVTPKKVRERGMRSCVTRIMSVRIEMDEDGVSKVVQARSLCETAHHQTTIKFYHASIPTAWEEASKLMKEVPAGSDLWNKPVWLSCNCEHYCFSCEVALSKYGASNVLHSTGEAPMRTNPGMTPWACKHIVALAPLAISVNREHKPEDIQPETYPLRPGRPPKALVEMTKKKKLTPTEQEVLDVLPNVKDFL